MTVDTTLDAQDKKPLAPLPLLSSLASRHANNLRGADYPLLMPASRKRWSPRAFSAEPLSGEEIHTLFEAARWSPSRHNQQPWRFIYARAQNAKAQLLEALTEPDRAWVGKAPVLVIAFSHVFFQHNGQANRWAAFDTGAAWMSLALQAQYMGLATHALGDFDEEQVYAITGVNPEEYVAMTVIAVGRPGDPNTLPPQLKAQEHPTERVPLSDIIYEYELTPSEY